MRFSFNRAFRAPSLINNFLDVGIINQVDLRTINPAFAAAPGGPHVQLPDHRPSATTELVEQQVDAYEVAYTGVIAKRATVTAAFYYNKSKDDIYFTQNGRYRATNPPPGWVAKVGPMVGPALGARHPRSAAAALRRPAHRARRRAAVGVQLSQSRHGEATRASNSASTPR